MGLGFLDPRNWKRGSVTNDDGSNNITSGGIGGYIKRGWSELDGSADREAEDRRGAEMADKFDVPGFDRRDQQAQDMLSRFGQFDSGYGEDQQALIDLFRNRAMGADSQSRRDLRDSADRSRRFALAQGAAGGSPLSARMASQQLGGIESGLRGQQASAGIMERGQSGQIAGQLVGQARGQNQMDQQLIQSGMFGAMDRDLANALSRQSGTISGYNYGKGTQSDFGTGLGNIGKIGMNAGKLLGWL
jgi:hypothetical protein